MLQRYVFESLAAPLRLGFLRYFRLTTPTCWRSWHASIAKNTSHAAGRSIVGCRGILVNVDGDNITPSGFVDQVVNMVPRMRVSPDDPVTKLSGVQWKNNKVTGTTGRIGTTCYCFETLNGYDESFLPSGFQDLDLLKRLSRVGAVSYVAGTGADIGNAIENVWQDRKPDFSVHVQAKMMNVEQDPSKPALDWQKMNTANARESARKLREEGMVRNKDSQIGVVVQEIVLAGSERLLGEGRRRVPGEGRRRVPGEAGVAAAASAGEAFVPAGPWKKVEIYTFGVNNLAGTFPDSTAAQRIRDITFTRGGPPIAVPNDLLSGPQRTRARSARVGSAPPFPQPHPPAGPSTPPPAPGPSAPATPPFCPIPADQLRHEAFQQTLKRRMDFFVDARCFIDFDPGNRRLTDGHIGTHWRLMEVMVANEHFHPVLIRCKELAEQLRDREALRIGVFCRAGEKRSVGLAAVLSHVFQCSYNPETVETTHLSRFYWQFKTCGGRCPDCTLQENARRDTALRYALEQWDVIAV